MTTTNLNNAMQFARSHVYCGDPAVMFAQAKAACRTLAAEVERLTAELAKCHEDYKTQVDAIVTGLDEIECLRDLLLHAQIHSGYPNCGRGQMTTDQKALYDTAVRAATNAAERSE